jgi:hypothetical protein
LAQTLSVWRVGCPFPIDRLLKTLIAMPSSSALDRADPLGERRVAGNPLNHPR